ncbi:hypothetical protein ACLOJK_039222, partial [Asimina triloba]
MTALGFHGSGVGQTTVRRQQRPFSGDPTSYPATPPADLADILPHPTPSVRCHGIKQHPSAIMGRSIFTDNIQWPDPVAHVIPFEQKPIQASASSKSGQFSAPFDPAFQPQAASPIFGSRPAPSRTKKNTRAGSPDHPATVRSKQQQLRVQVDHGPAEAPSSDCSLDFSEIPFETKHRNIIRSQQDGSPKI